MNVAPTAPSMKDMQTVQGYENVTFEKGLIQPPMVPDWQQEPPTRQDISGIPSLTEEDVREAVLRYASANCCYGKGVARDMVVQQIRMSSAFHYTLETFGEKRETVWRFEPYEGQVIDGPNNGIAPGPWDIDVRPYSLFTSAVSASEIPHTAFVKPCHECVGNGRVRCGRCSGFGQENCTWCSGTGRKSDGTCTWCTGSGRTRCDTCFATGQVKCSTCNGRGQVKGFVQLVVTWTNHKDDFISDTASLPSEKIREVTGQTVFQEENPRVWPIMHSGDQSVNDESNRLVQRHGMQYGHERILKQKHSLRVIPIADSSYLWKNKTGSFYVYGFENEVHFENYPQSCCWCCTIL